MNETTTESIVEWWKKNIKKGDWIRIKDRHNGLEKIIEFGCLERHDVDSRYWFVTASVPKYFYEHVTNFEVLEVRRDGVLLVLEVTTVNGVKK